MEKEGKKRGGDGRLLSGLRPMKNKEASKGGGKR